jgi:DNA excision repair protein ERCC-5
MGVKDLWQLLSPIGRRVSIETLEGKTLAIDASIWITQFLKAMRDDDGKMIKNAHLIGTLRRVLKLLFHKIRPVFVFDGMTPALKYNTVKARRHNTEKNEVNKKIAAQRLFRAQLKQHVLTTMKRAAETDNQSSGAHHQQPAQFVQSFVLPTAGNRSAATSSPGIALRHDDLSNGVSQEPSDHIDAINSSQYGNSSTTSQLHALEGKAVASSNSSSSRHLGGDGDDYDDVEWVDGYEDLKSKDLSDDDEAVVHRRKRPLHRSSRNDDYGDDPDWELPATDQLDVEALAALPPHIRKRLLEDARTSHRRASRDHYIPVAGNPELYSQTQLSNFLNTRSDASTSSLSRPPLK